MGGGGGARPGQGRVGATGRAWGGGRGAAYGGRAQAPELTHFAVVADTSGLRVSPPSTTVGGGEGLAPDQSSACAWPQREGKRGGRSLWGGVGWGGGRGGRARGGAWGAQEGRRRPGKRRVACKQMQVPSSSTHGPMGRGALPPAPAPRSSCGGVVDVLWARQCRGLGGRRRRGPGLFGQVSRRPPEFGPPLSFFLSFFSEGTQRLKRRPMGAGGEREERKGDMDGVRGARHAEEEDRRGARRCGTPLKAATLRERHGQVLSSRATPGRNAWRCVSSGGSLGGAKRGAGEGTAFAPADAGTHAHTFSLFLFDGKDDHVWLGGGEKGCVVFAALFQKWAHKGTRKALPSLLLGSLLFLSLVGPSLPFLLFSGLQPFLGEGGS